MKVVLFCGGFGMRMREYSESVPKPMVTIGYRPMLWHIMKYYAHYGFKDFILCLGYKADMIKNYFLNYDECLSNNFTLTEGGKKLHLLNSDIQDWRITFVDTGLSSNIGQRLMAVQDYLKDDEIFMANYSDGLTDLHLPEYLAYFQNSNKIASFLSVKPGHSFHLVNSSESGKVNEIVDVKNYDMWINGGFFIFKKQIFDYMNYGEELVCEPFQRLIAQEELVTYQYDGFWACMDTFKEKQQFDDLVARGDAPWEVWKTPRIDTSFGNELYA